MNFGEGEIERLDLTKVDNVSRLVIEYLCGEKHYPQLSPGDKNLLVGLMDNAKREGLNYEQFNELLLLLNQDRVGKDFFKFLSEKKEIISLEDLKQRVIKFRGYAMLCYGNFRFAYKQFIQKSENELEKQGLERYWKGPSELREEFRNRPSKMLEIEKIERDKTWHLGEISGTKITKEAKILKRKIQQAKKGKNISKRFELLKFVPELTRLSKQAVIAQKKALKNTDIYLTWDYMDVYIATSMRNKWEFEETFYFAESVFNDTRLKKLNLRYFDPTQSKCANPRDKGLIEGLMLKRALCTIYLVQESDTMGKDSELAATLAQSKPVIAYVPRYNPSEYAEKIKKYPLDFFKKRLLILEAEEIFDDPNCIEKLRKYSPNFEKKIDNFLNKLENHRQAQPFSLWTGKEINFKRDNDEDFLEMCTILAIAECYNFDRRAKFLRERHPLSMQVDLQSGVANGVLVVRDDRECSKLLYKILTNDMRFTIEHRDEGFTILEEEISKCPFRVVTDYEKLTNSFWNLFA